jgi:hypothetical protein
VADAEFAAKCGCHIKPTPGVCQSFPPEIMAAVGVTSSDFASFTPAGTSQGLAAVAPTMTVEASATVNGVAAYVFKGSGRELDVPTSGAPLPTRLIRPGVYETLFSDWNTAVPTKPASCA